MGKVIGNANKVSFAKGGTTKMFGKQGADKAVAGSTAVDKGGASRKMAAGGKGKMFGKGHAGSMEAGVTAKKSQ